MAKLLKLPPEKQQRLIRALEALNQLHQEVDELEQCGVDCQRHRAEIARQRERGEALRKRYAANATSSGVPAS